MQLKALNEIRNNKTLLEKELLIKETDNKIKNIYQHNKLAEILSKLIMITFFFKELFSDSIEIKQEYQNIKLLIKPVLKYIKANKKKFKARFNFKKSKEFKDDTKQKEYDNLKLHLQKRLKLIEKMFKIIIIRMI